MPFPPHASPGVESHLSYQVNQRSLIRLGWQPGTIQWKPGQQRRERARIDKTPKPCDPSHNVVPEVLGAHGRGIVDPSAAQQLSGVDLSHHCRDGHKDSDGCVRIRCSPLPSQPPRGICGMGGGGGVPRGMRGMGGGWACLGNVDQLVSHQPVLPLLGEGSRLLEPFVL